MWSSAARVHLVLSWRTPAFRRQGVYALTALDLSTDRRQRARAAKQERVDRERRDRAVQEQQHLPQVQQQQIPTQYQRPPMFHQPQQRPSFMYNMLLYAGMGFGLFLGISLVNVLMVVLFR